MKLNENQIAKINPLLNTLIRAEEGEKIQVTFKLQKPFVEDPFEPQDFPKYEDYRQAFLGYRQQEYATFLERHILALEKLGLRIGRRNVCDLILVAQGSPKQIAEALELSAIVAAWEY